MSILHNNYVKSFVVLLKNAPAAEFVFPAGAILSGLKSIPLRPEEKEESMTNEQLAEAIKKNKNKKYIAMLWKNVQNLMYIKADKYYYAMIEKFKAAGADIWDLRQELYFAFLEAVKAYDPEKNLKFVTYLEFHIKNTVNRAAGICGRNEPLNQAESLDKPVPGTEDITLAEMISDEKNNILKIIKGHTDSEIIRNETQKLHGKQKITVMFYYFDNKSDAEIAQDIGTTASNVFQIRRRALSNLRKSPVLNFIYYSSFV